MLCRDTLSSVDDIEEGLDLPTASPVSLSRQELSPALTSLSTMPHRLNCVSILVILLVTVLDLLLQFKHIEVQLANLPTYFGIKNPKCEGVWSARWWLDMCVCA